MKHLNKLRLLVLMGLMACFGSVQAQADDLQEYINKAANATLTRASNNDTIVVDLSSFSATERTTTLEIATGKIYRFVNGTLKKAAGCQVPLITISNGSTVEVGASDNDIDKRAWITANGIITGVETIKMQGGTLKVTRGVVEGGYSLTYGSTEYDNSVLMTSDDDTFVLSSPENYYGAWISGPVVCNASKANIMIENGHMHTNTTDYGTIKSYSDITYSGKVWLHVELLSKDNVVDLSSGLSWSMEVTALQRGYNEAIVVGQDYQLTHSDLQKVDFKGSKEYQLRLSSNKIVLGIDDLQDFINNPGSNNGTGTEEDPITADISCSGVDVNDDLAFKDDLQYFINGKQPETTDCQGTIRQNGGNVTVPAHTTVTYADLNLYGCGCSKYVYVYGTLIIDVNIYIYNYLRFIHLRPGGRVIIRGLTGEVTNEIFYVEGGEIEYHGGDCTGGQYGWYCSGGVIYIRDGILRGGTCGGWTGIGGRSYHYGGTVYGGIRNYGWHYFYGGTCSGAGSYTIYNYKGGKFYYYGGTCSDGGKIWNEGDLYIDGEGSISCGDIYCIKGGCIYILKHLTFTLRLVFTEENIVSGATVVVGDDSYTLTQDDVNKLDIILPDGYEWKYDASCGCISIIKSTGISGVSSNQPEVKQAYDATGREVGEGSKGLNIQLMTDGTVRKVNNK